MFHVDQNKPEFCELFVICRGKQVFLRIQNDEKIIEDDDAVIVARMKDKITFKDWFEKMFTERNMDSPERRSSSRSLTSSSSSATIESPVSPQNQWEFYLQEIESYYQDLLASNLEEDNDVSQISPTETDVTRQNDSITVN